jgi:repressor LexA
LAGELGVSRNTLASWEAGHRNPEVSAVRKLADYFGVSLDYLLGRCGPWQTAESSPSYPDAESDPENRLVHLPVVRILRAGQPLLAPEAVEGWTAIPAADVQDGSYFFLRVGGDDLLGARIRRGDLVLVRQQETAENGDIAVVLVEGETEAVLRRVFRTNGQWLLQPENPALQPAVVPRRQARIVGKVVRVQFDV